MERTEEEFKRLVYDLMNGSINLKDYPFKESEFVENEFADGKLCQKAYEDLFNASMRLCLRLGVDEDRDVEMIISSFFTITEHLCMKMYDYGKRFAKEPIN